MTLPPASSQPDQSAMPWSDVVIWAMVAWTAGGLALWLLEKPQSVAWQVFAVAALPIMWVSHRFLVGRSAQTAAPGVVGVLWFLAVGWTVLATGDAAWRLSILLLPLLFAALALPVAAACAMAALSVALAGWVTAPMGLNGATVAAPFVAWVWILVGTLSVGWVLRRGRLVVAPISPGSGAHRGIEQASLAQRMADREMSERLSLAVQAGRLGVWELSADGRSFTIDRRVAEIYGLTVSNPPVVSLKTRLDSLHPHDLEQVQASYQSLLQGARDYQVAYRIKRTDGQQRWLRTAVVAVRDDAGQILRIVGMDQDITDTMTAQARLLASNMRLLLALKMAHASVWEIDTAMRMHWDERGNDIYGVDLVHDPEGWRQRIIMEDHAALTEWDRLLLDGSAREIQLEYRIQHPERGLRFIRIVGQIERDSTGRLMQATGIDMDITSRREASARIQELSGRLAVAAQASGMGIWQYAPDLDTLWWDPQQYVLHGMSVNTFAPSLAAWQTLCFGDDAQRLVRLIDDCRRTLEPGSCEIRIQDTADGIWTLRLVCQPVLDDQQRLTQLVGASFDVTAEREATAEVERARQEAEAASRAKSAFLANMSHEIRTPMNAVLGMTQLALDADVPDPARAYVARAHQSATELLGTLNDVLDLSKIEAGKVVLEHAVFDLDALLEAIVATQRDAANHKNLPVALERQPARLGPWQADALRLRQVLMNLLSNAVKFTTTGRVILRVVARDGPGLRFEVHDTGLGMTPEQQSRVFDAFEQADISTSRRFGGTGLGLTICKQIVGLMGGELGVRSQAGVGSLFWFTCPSMTRAPETTLVTQLPDQAIRKPAQATPKPSLQGMHVLLVEDNPVNQELATLVLERQGIQVTQASSGDECLSHLRAQLPDLVLMDIQMPGMDGLEATRRIRAMGGALARLPIIAMTANALTGDREASLDAGMNDHITKPVNNDVLMRVLARWRQH